MTTPEDLRKLMHRIAAGDPSAPADVRRLADQLYALAERLEARAEQPTRSVGGMGDRVQMKLIGPDGEIKHQTDTDPPSQEIP